MAVVVPSPAISDVFDVAAPRTQRRLDRLCEDARAARHALARIVPESQLFGRHAHLRGLPINEVSVWCFSSLVTAIWPQVGFVHHETFVTSGLDLTARACSPKMICMPVAGNRDCAVAVAGS